MACEARVDVEIEAAAEETVEGHQVNRQVSFGEDSDTGEVDLEERVLPLTEAEIDRRSTNLDAAGDLGGDLDDQPAMPLSDDALCDEAGLTPDVERLASYYADVAPELVPGSAATVWRHYSDPANKSKLTKLWADLKKKYDKTVPKVSVPTFARVENPAGWEEKYFKPKFKGKGKDRKYSHHAHVGGARIAPQAEGGTYTYGGWQYLYTGECQLPGSGRLHATHEEPMPPERLSKLSWDKLQRLGFSERNLDDPLFYFFLLLPLWDNPDEQQKGFFSEVRDQSNGYAVKELKLNPDAGRTFALVSIIDIVRWFGIVMRDGSLGGAGGSIHLRWARGADPETDLKDETTIKTMTYTQFLLIKRVIHMSDNGASYADRAHGDYDPSHKMRLPFECIQHNTAHFFEIPPSDACVDERSFVCFSWGPTGDGLIGEIQGKPGCTRGGQIVMIVEGNIKRKRLLGFLFRHKKHDKTIATTVGERELILLLEQIVRMDNTIADDDKPQKRPSDHGLGFPVLWTKDTIKLHTTCDNWFSGPKPRAFISSLPEGLDGSRYGLLCTVRKDRLTEHGNRDTEEWYVHKNKTGVNEISKSARFSKPVIGTKIGSADVIMSRQSTGVLNLSSMNSAKIFQIWEEVRKRGKRDRTIEMDTLRKLYLLTYHIVDKIDQASARLRLKIISRRYWFGGMINGIELGAVMAHSWYQEIYRELVPETWRQRHKELDQRKFVRVLALRMCEYDPRLQMYPGDEKFRIVTQLRASVREAWKQKGRTVLGDTVTVPELRAESAVAPAPAAATNPMTPAATPGAPRASSSASTSVSTRFCNLLHDYHTHHGADKIVSVPSGRQCAFCGKPAYTKCSTCDAPLHCMGGRGGKDCHAMYHDPVYRGMAQCDTHKRGSPAGGGRIKWALPSERAVRDALAGVKRLVAEQLCDDMRIAADGDGSDQ